MEFKLLHDIVKNIQDTIWNTGVESVKSLRSHTYSAKVVNFPKTQKINGVVSVSNQKRVETELKKSTVTLKTILKWLKSLKFPTEIKVSNFPAFPEWKFPESFRVSNFPKPPEFPKNIRVSNQPTKEIKDVADAVKDLNKALKALKLNPKINVEAAKIPNIVVPEPRVTVTQQDIDYEKLAGIFPQPIPAKEIDYEKLADAIASRMVSVGSGGGGRSNGFIGRDGKPTKAVVDSSGRILTNPDYFIADKEVGASITYTGNENPEGAWYMMKVAGDQIRYASSTNNPGYEDYAAAWDDKENLEYDYPSKVSF